MSNEALDLRLEDVGYHFEDGSWKVHIDGPPMLDEEAARKFAALEFFDRALLRSIDRPADEVFIVAQALTLLRFGVRIVGLEKEES